MLFALQGILVGTVALSILIQMVLYHSFWNAVREREIWEWKSFYSKSWKKPIYQSNLTLFIGFVYTGPEVTSDNELRNIQKKSKWILPVLFGAIALGSLLGKQVA